MLDNDYLLPISFATAAQIGLEETVLLTFLKQQVYSAKTNVLRIEVSHLSAQLPFWTLPMVMRQLANLQISQLLSFQRSNDVVEIHLSSASHMTADWNKVADVKTADVTTKNDGLMDKMDRLHKASREKKEEFTSNPQFTPKPQVTPKPHNYTAKPAERQYGEPPVPTTNDRRGVTDFDLYLEQKERSRQPDQWLPEEATIEQITQAGIAREFALSLQTEFLLRIKEQRKNVRTWNSEFFKYVKRQWQYKQSDRSSYEGTSSSTKFNKTSREQVSDALTNIHDTDW